MDSLELDTELKKKETRLNGIRAMKEIIDDKEKKLIEEINEYKVNVYFNEKIKKELIEYREHLILKNNINIWIQDETKTYIVEKNRNLLFEGRTKISVCRGGLSNFYASIRINYNEDILEIIDNATEFNFLEKLFNISFCNNGKYSDSKEELICFLNEEKKKYEEYFSENNFTEVLSLPQYISIFNEAIKNNPSAKTAKQLLNML